MTASRARDRVGILGRWDPFAPSISTKAIPFTLVDGHPLPTAPSAREWRAAQSEREVVALTHAGGVALDWNTVFARVDIDGLADRHLWSRFAVELDERTIVVPHLFDQPRPFARYRRGRDHCTFVETPSFAVFLARSDEHETFVAREIVPAVHRRIPLVAVVRSDLARCRLAPLDAAPSFDVGHLPLLLNRWVGANDEAPAFPDDLFERDADYARFFVHEVPGPDDIASIEAHPLRLWHVLFGRGWSRRYEIVDGEVPLILELPTRLATNRTLMQCVRDAERLEEMHATEEAGWIRCGAFRMRQHDRILDLRVGLSPQDRRVAFGCERLSSGASELPSIPGVLLSGGDNGKTEMVHGRSWATAELDSPAEVARFLPRVVAEIERWTGLAPDVRDRSSGYPADPRNSERWILRRSDEEPWLDVFVPFGQADCLPFWAIAGHLGLRQESNTTFAR